MLITIRDDPFREWVHRWSKTPTKSVHRECGEPAACPLAEWSLENTWKSCGQSMENTWTAVEHWKSCGQHMENKLHKFLKLCLYPALQCLLIAQCSRQVHAVNVKCIAMLVFL